MIRKKTSTKKGKMPDKVHNARNESEWLCLRGAAGEATGSEIAHARAAEMELLESSPHLIRPHHHKVTSTKR